MAKKAISKEVIDDVPIILDEFQPLSNTQKYLYLEQLRDYIYKDVVLADTKAGLALTLVTLAIASAITMYKDINIFNTLWIISFTFAGLSVLCSLLTILPRSYVTHEMVADPNHWVNLKGGAINELKRRFLDALYVLHENMWQKQAKGTTDSIKLLLNSTHENERINSLQIGMQRAFLAQTLKYLWVGKALLFAFLTFLFTILSLLVSINTSKKLLESKKSTVKVEQTQPKISFKDTIKHTNSNVIPLKKVDSSRKK